MQHPPSQRGTALQTQPFDVTCSTHYLQTSYCKIQFTLQPNNQAAIVMTCVYTTPCIRTVTSRPHLAVCLTPLFSTTDTSCILRQGLIQAMHTYIGGRDSCRLQLRLSAGQHHNNTGGRSLAATAAEDCR